MRREASSDCICIVLQRDLEYCVTQARVVALTAICLNRRDLTTDMRRFIDNVHERLHTFLHMSNLVLTVNSS